jgi:hypothetical protein
MVPNITRKVNGKFGKHMLYRYRFESINANADTHPVCSSRKWTFSGRASQDTLQLSTRRRNAVCIHSRIAILYGQLKEDIHMWESVHTKPRERRGEMILRWPRVCKPHTNDSSIMYLRDKKWYRIMSSYRSRQGHYRYKADQIIAFAVSQ